MKKVVVAIDGSEESRGVIDYAVHYANREAEAGCSSKDLRWSCRRSAKK